jgi:hypothetical protein
MFRTCAGCGKVFPKDHLIDRTEHEGYGMYCEPCDEKIEGNFESSTTIYFEKEKE